MIIALIVIALAKRDQQVPDVETAALRWVGDGVTQQPRRESGRWEVDVVRPDGSMVQVSLGDDLELRGLDEELGPAGTLAEDELRGKPRARAVRAAFAETGIGKVVSVEHDAGGGVEVRLRTDAASETMEVELNRDFEVVEVEQESLGDE